MRRPRLYAKAVDYVVAWIEVRRDLTDLDDLDNAESVVRPAASEMAPRSFEQALLMFDITKRQSDSLWRRTIRLLKQPATARRYRLLDQWIATRRKTLVLQMHYVRRAKEFQNMTSVRHAGQMLYRDLPFEILLSGAMDLQAMLDVERVPKVPAHQ